MRIKKEKVYLESSFGKKSMYSLVNRVIKLHGLIE